MNVCMSFNNTPCLLDSVVCTPVLTGTMSSRRLEMEANRHNSYPAGETQTHHSLADRAWPAASACIFLHRHAHLIIPPGKE